MSLFSNLGGSNQPASSATPASGAPAFKPLFGAGTSSTPAANPFGSATASSGASQTPGLGGALSGLGGGLGLGAKTTAPPTTGASAFSFPGTTSQPQTSGLNFSTTAGQTPQQSTTTNPLFPSQQTGAGGLFGGTGTQQHQQQGTSLAQSTAGNGTSRSAHFDHLLERGRKRNAGENGLGSFDALPTLQLGLGDIARKVRNLGTGGPSADQGQDRAA